MQLHADLSKPASVNANKVDWVQSPLPGVERRMLERDGEEVARATTIVRYAADSYFSPHLHSGGEEYYVLEGVFSDESGDYPAGYYVRNPVGSSHKPFTRSGCQILVKLQQMLEADQTYVTLDTNTAPRVIDSGVTSVVLHQFGSEQVWLREPEPGEQYTETANAGLEIFVLSGNVEIEGQFYGPRHWLRYPAAKTLPLTAKAEGTRLLVKQGHLRAV